MTFLEHIENIDKIIEEKKEIDRRNCLFNTSSFTTEGLGFTSTMVTTRKVGNNTHITEMGYGQIRNTTITQMPGGYQVTTW